MKLKPFHVDALISELAVWPSKKYLVAYSGGLDSHVLLHALRQIPSIKMTAIHINHDLSPNAKQWEAHCRKICKNLHVPLQVFQIKVKPEKGESLEAYARDQRYQIFKENVIEKQVLLTAHHQNDQIETLFLQLFRGAGIKGLAAMPKIKNFGQGKLLRPLLNFSRKQLEQYAKDNALVWIEDETNFDTCHDRNFIRHELMPVIKKRWSKVDNSLLRVTQNLASALSVLEDQAKADLFNVQGKKPKTLSASALLTLSQQRRFNVIRYWLSLQDFKMLNQRHLQQMDKDILQAKMQATPLLRIDNLEIRRFKDDVYGLKKQGHFNTKLTVSWNLKKSLNLPDKLGVLEARKVTGQGIKIQKIDKVIIKFRQGGERINLAKREGSHTLKKLFQEWQIPPWLRQRIPLLYINDELAAVIGYAIAEKFQAHDNEEGYYIIAACAEDDESN